MISREELLADRLGIPVYPGWAAWAAERRSYPAIIYGYRGNPGYVLFITDAHLRDGGLPWKCDSHPMVTALLASGLAAWFKDWHIVLDDGLYSVVRGTETLTEGWHSIAEAFVDVWLTIDAPSTPR